MADAPEGPAPKDAEQSTEQPAARAPQPPTTDDGDALSEAGRKALDTERKARRDAENRLKELEPLAEEARKRADSEKSELTKVGEALTEERTARQRAERSLMRFEVAADKGVQPRHVRFLHGDTKEEVEASADALLAEIGSGNGDMKPSMPGRPVERMASGKPSTAEEDEDPLALIAKARGQDINRR
jgi:hypothetical protein